MAWAIAALERTAHALDVNLPPIGLGDFDQTEAILEVLLAKPSYLEQQEERWRRSVHARLWPRLKDAQFAPPTRNATDEIVRSRVDRLDGKPDVDRQIHQRVPLVGGPAHSHQVDIFCRATWLKPQGHERASDEEKFASAFRAEFVQNLRNASPIELRRISHHVRLNQMTGVAKELIEAGVPLAGTPRSAGPAPSAERLRAALAATLTQAPNGPAAEALHGWLRAFRAGWPQAFETELGDVGKLTLARLSKADHEPGRLIKLRRIAMSNLARLY